MRIRKKENIVPPPEIIGSSHSHCIKEIGKIDDSIKLLLDCHRLISDEDFDEITKIV